MATYDVCVYISEALAYCLVGFVQVNNNNNIFLIKTMKIDKTKEMI